MCSCVSGPLLLKPPVVFVCAGYGFSDKPRGLEPSPYTIHTDADVAEQLLAHLGVTSAHVLAHDVGDTVAQELLARHNSRQVEAGLTGQHQRARCLSGSLGIVHADSPTKAAKIRPNHHATHATQLSTADEKGSLKSSNDCNFPFGYPRMPNFCNTRRALCEIETWS